MKIKNNNQITLIPCHLTGGLVLKYATGLNIKWIGARGLTYNSKNNPGEYRVIDGRVLKKRFYGWTDIGPVVTEPTNTQFKVDTPEVRAERERLYNERINDRKSVNKPIPKNPGTQSNSSRGSTRSSSTRGNARTTTKPTTTTVTSTTTSTTIPVSTPTENAGNYTIQRGDTLGALAKRFGMSVDELARLNNISNPNRIYAGRTLITKAPTVETPDIKVETPNIPDYGYGVRDSNLKLGTDLQYYPSYNLDELLRSYFSKLGLNFNDYKQLTADKLPTNVAPVSQEVKTFNPGNTILTPSYIALRNARLEDEALKRNKLLPFANQGTKLIRRK